MAREGLTEKQRRFVEAYAETANATESARRAGYKGNDKTLGAVGAENLRKPGIAAALQKLAERRTSRAIATIDECQAILTEIAKSGEDKDRIAAIDKLLKTHGAYLEKREVEHKGASVSFVFEDNGRGPAAES